MKASPDGRQISELTNEALCERLRYLAQRDCEGKAFHWSHHICALAADRIEDQMMKVGEAQLDLVKEFCNTLSGDIKK